MTAVEVEQWRLLARYERLPSLFVQFAHNAEPRQHGGMAFGSAQLHCTTSPRVALALLDNQSESTMRDALKGCGVEPVLLSGEPCERLSEEKFETYRNQMMQRSELIFGGLVGLGLKTRCSLRRDSIFDSAI